MYACFIYYADHDHGACPVVRFGRRSRTSPPGSAARKDQRRPVPKQLKPGDQPAIREDQERRPAPWRACILHCHNVLRCFKRGNCRILGPVQHFRPGSTLKFSLVQRWFSAAVLVMWPLSEFEATHLGGSKKVEQVKILPSLLRGSCAWPGPALMFLSLIHI